MPFIGAMGCVVFRDDLLNLVPSESGGCLLLALGGMRRMSAFVRLCQYALPSKSPLGVGITDRGSVTLPASSQTAGGDRKALIYKRFLSLLSFIARWEYVSVDAIFVLFDPSHVVLGTNILYLYAMYHRGMCQLLINTYFALSIGEK